ncbi:hypothetical protein CPB85DRAFT_1253232 [Mucidula mucida]|nr:hypothetical protein CPB85DRAFT_1253232 [Mucidula mucida]
MPKYKKTKRAKNLGEYAKRINKKPETREAPPDDSDGKDYSMPEDVPTQDSDEELIVLDEDDAPLMAKGDLLKWLNTTATDVHSSSAPTRCGPYHTCRLGQDVSVEREQREEQRLRLKPTAIKDFFKKNIEFSNNDRDADPPIPSTSLEVPSVPFPLHSNSLSANSSCAGSVASSAGSAVPASEISTDEYNDTDMDDVDDPIAPLLNDNSEEPIQLIDNAPKDLMTHEEMEEEGLETFGIDLVNKLGLDLFEEDNTPSHQTEQPPSSSTPSASASVPSAGPGPSIRPSPKEWFVYADKSFNLQAKEVGTGKASPLSTPTAKQVDDSIISLDAILRPRRKTGRGYKPPPPLGRVVLARLGLMLQLLHLFKRAGLKGWIEQSLEVVDKCSSKGPALACSLCRWTTAFCRDQKTLPLSKWGTHNASILDQDEDLANISIFICSRLGNGCWPTMLFNMSQDVFMPQWQGFELCGRYWDGDSLDAESLNVMRKREQQSMEMDELLLSGVMTSRHFMSIIDGNWAGGMKMRKQRLIPKERVSARWREILCRQIMDGCDQESLGQMGHLRMLVSSIVLGKHEMDIKLWSISLPKLLAPWISWTAIIQMSDTSSRTIMPPFIQLKHQTPLAQ